MWIDEGRVVHTISVPEPKVVIGEQCVDFLRKLGTTDQEILGQALEEQQEKFFERFEKGLLTEVGIAEGLPAEPVFDQDMTSVPELLERLAALPDLWQLDAIEACQDVLDG